MVKIKNTPPKMTEGKKTIIVTDVIVDQLKIVDDSGDITEEILSEIPEDIKTIDFRIIIPEE